MFFSPFEQDQVNRKLDIIIESLVELKKLQKRKLHHMDLHSCMESVTHPQKKKVRKLFALFVMSLDYF